MRKLFDFCDKDGSVRQPLRHAYAGASGQTKYHNNVLLIRDLVRSSVQVNSSLLCTANKVDIPNENSLKWRERKILMGTQDQKSVRKPFRFIVNSAFLPSGHLMN
jgi:hypothetical protein